MRRNGQSTLEFTLIFVIIIALLCSLFVMWKWSTDNIVKRQHWYNTTRREAGTLASPGESKDKIQDVVKPLTDTNMVYSETK